ncbi:hypothetical protein YC2023_046830 [Brassica napus]
MSHRRLGFHPCSSSSPLQSSWRLRIHKLYFFHLLHHSGEGSTIKSFPLRFADGRSSSTVQVQLFCLWEARNFRRGGVLMGVDMLLLDSQSADVIELQIGVKVC